jgi:hypothetical protein
MLITEAGTWQSWAASAVSASKASSGPVPTMSYSRSAATRIASLSGADCPPVIAACGCGARADVAASVDIVEPFLKQSCGNHRKLAELVNAPESRVGLIEASFVPMQVFSARACSCVD